MRRQRTFASLAFIAVILLSQGDPGCEAERANQRHSQQSRELREQTNELEDTLDRELDDGDGGQRRPGESLDECRQREFDWNC